MLRSQKEIFEKIIDDIGPFSPKKVIALLGKSGVGKSFVIKAVQDCVQEKYSAPICYIKGDLFCQSRDYYCLKQALSTITTEYMTKKEKKEVVTEGIQGVPNVGLLGKQLLSNFFERKERKQQVKSNFLNEDELEIIYRLNYLFDKRYSLIICDNIQYFDEKSLQLLYLLVTSDEDTFNFFSKSQFVLVCTDSDKDRPPIIETLLKEKTAISHKILPLQFEEIDSFLNKFKSNLILETEIKKVLFKLADGHLEVIKQITLQMNNASFEYNLTTQSSDAQVIIEELITSKLKQMGASGSQISQLLEYASLIGRTFSNDELSKIVELDSQEFHEAIQKSNEMELITSEQKYSNFSHDIIRLLFRNKAKNNLYHYYQRMSTCIKELYPGEYKQRIDIEECLGEMYNAAILVVLYYAKKNYVIETHEEHYLQILNLYPQIKSFFDDMQEAFRNYQIGDYKKTISILDTVEDFLPIQLLAERDILKSVSLTKLLNDEWREEAILCLKDYTLNKLNNEGDLYLRILLSQTSAFSHMSRVEEAKKCEKDIYSYLEPRIQYDDNARTVVNILRRKSNSMHECNYAVRIIKKSVEYFAPLFGQTAPLHPVQYLMSLGNYAGVLIECAKFSEAYAESLKAQTLIQNNDISFPRLHIIDNNLLLSMYFLDTVNAKEILHAYKKLLTLEQNADNIFIVSNYCALLAVNGYIEEAYQLLQKQKKQLTQNSEHFYETCINNNLLVINMFYKNFASAQELLNELISHTVGVIDESYYKKKYSLFQQLIDMKYDIPAQSIDTFLFDFCSEYQEAWQYWGRSFDYTAQYYWSDM